MLRSNAVVAANSLTARDLQHLEAAFGSRWKAQCKTKPRWRSTAMCDQDVRDSAESHLCLFSPMCHWTNGRARVRNKNAPTRVSPSRLGQPEREIIGSLSAPHPGKLRTGGGLVKPGPLTCWQSGPQRLVKRPCHAHAAHRQKRGFFDDSLLARLRTTRIGPCRDVRDGIGHCTHSLSSNIHTSPTLETHQRQVSRLACKKSTRLHQRR